MHGFRMQKMGAFRAPKAGKKLLITRVPAGCSFYHCGWMWVNMGIKDKTNEYLRKQTEQVGRAQRQGQVCSIISFKYWFKASRSCQDPRRGLWIINRRGSGPIRTTEKPASPFTWISLDKGDTEIRGMFDRRADYGWNRLIEFTTIRQL